jgi:hypothetical protein
LQNTRLNLGGGSLKIVYRSKKTINFKGENLRSCLSISNKNNNSVGSIKFERIDGTFIEKEFESNPIATFRVIKALPFLKEISSNNVEKLIESFISFKKKDLLELIEKEGLAAAMNNKDLPEELKIVMKNGRHSQYAK